MGNTGNSDTYPYGIRFVGGEDVVYNRVTDEDIEAFAPFGTGAPQLVNKLVAEFKAASKVEQENILDPKKVAA